ncbi:MAG: cation diffusion facilitator family transporter, partial [Phycisphaerae bacterium]
VSVVSEAIHSGIDLIAAVIALLAVRVSGKPADTEHPFGHGKIENISGVIEALLIFVAAGWILYEAVHKLMHPKPLDAPAIGVAVMLVSAALNVVISKMLFRVGRQTGSIALQADAWHHRTDVYTSAGVMAALATITAGGWLWPKANLLWIDPVAAIGVAVLILRAAYDLTRQSLYDLLDVSLPAEETQTIVGILEGLSPKVCRYHKLRTRKSGAMRFVEFHMQVHPRLSVEESHALVHEVIARIHEHFPESHISAHVEPCEGCPACKPAGQAQQEASQPSRP